jgi:hypothetical protein
MLQIPAADPVYHNRERDAIRNFIRAQLSLLIEIYSGAKLCGNRNFMSYRRQTLGTVCHRSRRKQQRHFLFAKSLLILSKLEMVVERTG